jgi:hypothetical protein
MVISITLLARFIPYFRLRSAHNWEYLLPGCLAVKDLANTLEDQVGSSYHVVLDFWVAHDEVLLIGLARSVRIRGVLGSRLKEVGMKEGVCFGFYIETHFLYRLGLL